MSDKINPCPFFGSEHVKVTDDDYGCWSCVTCHKCGAEGPFSDDGCHIENWNNAASSELCDAVIALMDFGNDVNSKRGKWAVDKAKAALAKARGE